MVIKSVDINLIMTNADQPRKYFDNEKISELAESIQEYGLLQPIIVKEFEGKYQIIAGERRYQACKLAGKEYVDVIVQDVNRFVENQIALLENIQRENLSPIEEALAYKKLIDDYGMSQIEVANSIKKKPSTVSNIIRLLKLDPFVQEKISQNLLTQRHGRAMLSLSNDEQIQYATKAIEKDLSVKELETMISRSSKAKPATKKNIIANNNYKLAVNTIKHALKIIEDTGINVSYAEELDDDAMVINIKLSR